MGHDSPIHACKYPHIFVLDAYFFVYMCSYQHTHIHAITQAHIHTHTHSCTTSTHAMHSHTHTLWMLQDTTRDSSLSRIECRVDNLSSLVSLESLASEARVPFMRTPYLIHMFIWVALFVYVKTLKNVQTIWYKGAKIQNGHVHSKTFNILFQYFSKNVCVWHVWTLSICIADVLICVCLYVFVCLCLHLSVCVRERQREFVCVCVPVREREKEFVCVCVPVDTAQLLSGHYWGLCLECDLSHMNDTCHIWMRHVTYEWDMSHMKESAHLWTS